MNLSGGRGYIVKAMLLFFVAGIVSSCEIHQQKENKTVAIDSVSIIDPRSTSDHTVQPAVAVDTFSDEKKTGTEQLASLDTGIRTGKVNPNELIRFAEKQIGIPYVWASSDPQVGFDCSGFITYVFNHFNISVPRSSIDFTNVGKTVEIRQARPGDFILFTGTNPMEEQIGHMGIVVLNNDLDGLQFIHATSGKAMAVTITRLNDQYLKRFVRISRVFKQND